MTSPFRELHLTCLENWAFSTHIQSQCSHFSGYQSYPSKNIVEPTSTLAQNMFRDRLLSSLNVSSKPKSNGADARKEINAQERTYKRTHWKRKEAFFVPLAIPSKSEWTSILPTVLLSKLEVPKRFSYLLGTTRLSATASSTTPTPESRRFSVRARACQETAAK